MRPLITLTALLLLTACGTTAPPPTPPIPPIPPTTASAPRPTGLVITLGAVDAAMGLRSLDIQLTNHTTTPAEINGYPQLRVLDNNHTPLQVTISHGSAGVATVEGFDTPPKPITLHPGQTVHAALLWRNLVTHTDRKATLGVYLDIAPTPDTPTRTLRPDGGIDLGNTTTLGLSAWATPRTPTTPTH